MIEKLMVYLRYEEQLLEELVGLAQEQQKALVLLNLTDLDDISRKQEEMLSNLKQAEDARIKFMMDWLKITRTSASKMTMSQILNFSDKNNYSVLQLMQESMNSLSNQLVNLNMANRVLSNRAKNSVTELISILTNGTNNVCNVRV
ncbi:MAG: flagellar export chaperone FlgN [Candidatus Kapaibacterium sp.]